MSTTTVTYEPGTLHQVPPGDLLLERNIRESKPSAELVASVKDLGVLEPITAVVNTDGQLVVRFGHRRTLAAAEAGRPTVPVYVVGDDDTADKAEVDRIIRQRDENTHREGLTAADELGVYEQLAAFGLSPTQIARRTRTTKDTVQAALVVSTSEVARQAAATLTLDQAAVIAEFEDNPETVEDLLAVAEEEPTAFAHVVQQHRDERDRRAAYDSAVTELTEAGVTVVKAPTYNEKTAWPLDELVDADKNVLTVEGHGSCPGHVAWVVLRWVWVDDDGNVIGRPDEVKDQVQRYLPVFGCSAPKANGHTGRYESAGGRAAEEPSDEAREKARAERRLVIENNKAWDSAQVVRREWLAEFAKLKTPPKGAAAFIVQALAEDRHTVASYDGQSAGTALAIEWGLPSVKGRYGVEVVGIPDRTTENRALHVALVLVLAAYEAASDRMDWRRNGKTERHGRYLAFLKACGYGLSDVEKFALSTKTV